ncbi:thioesterase family protein [Paracoccaceae bacterium]|nr:thioesterase family protein [Paracoccaceae bacterium]
MDRSLPRALFVAIGLKKNYLAIEEYFLLESFGNYYLERNLNSVFVKLTSDHIDKNGHVSEAGYLTVANLAYWKICEQVGLLKLYSKYKVSGIVFDTYMEFKKEVFEGEEVMINLRFNITNDTRKIVRLLDIYDKENRSVVKITSNGGFLDLEKRKIVEPPKQILDTCLKYLRK